MEYNRMLKNHIFKQMWFFGKNSKHLKNPINVGITMFLGC